MNFLSDDDKFVIIPVVVCNILSQRIYVQMGILLVESNSNNLGISTFQYHVCQYLIVKKANVLQRMFCEMHENYYDLIQSNDVSHWLGASLESSLYQPHYHNLP